MKSFQNDLCLVVSVYYEIRSVFHSDGNYTKAQNDI